jgi:hypothetical protein
LFWRSGLIWLRLDADRAPSGEAKRSLGMLGAKRTTRWPGIPAGLGVFLLALGTRVAYWAIFQAHYEPVSDAGHYWGIASNLAAGKGFSHSYPGGTLHETAFRLPLWPALLALVLVVFGTHLGVAMGLNVVIGSLVAVQAAAVAGRIAGWRAGAVAGAVVAVYPTLVANDVGCLSEPLGLLLLLAVVRIVAARRWTWAALATGLFILTKDGAGIVLLGLIALVGLWVDWRQAVRFTAIVLLVVAPWIARNEVQLGHPVLTTSFGYNLAAAYSTASQETPIHFVDPIHDSAFAPYWPQRADEARWDATLQRIGLHGLAVDPLSVVKVGWYHLGSMAGFHTRTVDVAEHLDGRVIDVEHVSRPAYYAVSLLGMVGLWRWRRHRAVHVLVTVVGLLVALNLVTVWAPRLRAPFDLACAIGVGLLFSRLAALQQRKETPVTQPHAIGVP